jgi:tetratricopeptide (TPR) repeat protein
MATPSAPAPVEFEVARIRELSRGGRHAEALAAAEALANTAPENRDAVYLVAANQRCLNHIPEALAALQRLERHHPRYSLLHQERGHCYAALLDVQRAIGAFERGLGLNPALTASWAMLERLYRTAGDPTKAAAAAEQLAVLNALPPEIVRAGSLFSDGELSAAEMILRGYLLHAGEHAEALRLLARIERQRGDHGGAELHLQASLKLDPNYRAARVDYARVLIDRQKYPQALDVVNGLLELAPGDEDCLSLCAAACVGLGRYEQAIALYYRLLSASPDSAELRVALGHCLKSIGRQKEAIEAYQSAAAARPSFGDAYWSLANLKSYRFSEAEVAHMRAEESASAASAVDRYHLCFALGKAHEDRSKYEESWQFYERGNKLKRAESRYDPELIERNTREQIEVCTAEFLAARAGAGAPAPDPIFIVGLPRSGSTLIEQILASHSEVEGTQELHDIPRIVVDLQGPQSGASRERYPALLANLAPEDFRSLGERYVKDTRPYRGDKPFFIDKMPNNFRHIGLIHLMLPNTKIIDVRREPMACCFSNLKQLFAAGQEFTYDIEDIARYYRNYLELMRHWDTVLPGKVLRVMYEDVVDDLKGNVRRILEFCNLEFRPACIEFHKTERSVRTASSEQVRQPIFRDGLHQWRKYEPWLGPLKDALGDALIRYDC